MAIIVDGIELDESNVEFNFASDFANLTDRFIFLTGKAGTGKTTFLKYLRNRTNKKAVILAPTGVSAINAGGQTIHSFFQIKPSIYVPDDKRLRKKANTNDSDNSTIYNHFEYKKEKLQIIRNLELLIIDEISMVRCDLLDVIDRLLRIFRRREKEPFGGVQVILIGDAFQLAPIADKDQWNILKIFYKSPFFFSSQVFREMKPVYIELKKIYRQNEKEFIELLNRIRVNQITLNEIDLLNSKFDPIFVPKHGTNYITLATHNCLADITNQNKLNELETELKLFEATIIDSFPESIMPTDKLLRLKEGAQVMFIKNDKTKGYYNGKIGCVEKIEDTKITVKLSEGNDITVEKFKWENIKYSWNDNEKKIEEEVIGTFLQFPLKLAWAITVHKSQGLTFERVIADLGNAFASGQVYVALSRCTTFNGIVLKTKIDRGAIITDPEVIQFAKNETPTTLIVKELNSGKADFFYKKVREAIKSHKFEDAYENLLQAIKCRNDFETDSFKRYFIVISNKFSFYLEQYFKIIQKVEHIEEEKNNLQLTTKELHTINDKQKNEILEQKKSINLLQERINEIETISRCQHDEIKNLKSDKTKYVEKLTKVNLLKTKEKEKRIGTLEDQLLTKETEINQQNIKICEFMESHENDKTNISQLSKDLMVSKKEIFFLKTQINEYDNSLREHKIKTNQVEYEMLKLNNEIKRLNELKWYDKIIGKS